MNITVRPWNVWPVEKTASRRDAPFRSQFSKTTRLLDSELNMLNARDAVLELEITESDIRRDGWVKENARPWSPGVILSFTSKVTGPVRYPCDTFFTWQDNIRAIALALQALRRVDRYGVTKRGEQYTGWKALPSNTAATMTTESAAELLSQLTPYSANEMLTSAGYAKEAIKSARSKAHPDRNNGNRGQWDNIETARSVLSSHHGVSL